VRNLVPWILVVLLSGCTHQLGDARVEVLHRAPATLTGHVRAIEADGHNVTVDDGLLAYASKIPACYLTCDIEAVLAPAYDDAAMRAISRQADWTTVAGLQRAAAWSTARMNTNDSWGAPLAYLEAGGGPRAAVAFVAALASADGTLVDAWVGPAGGKVHTADGSTLIIGDPYGSTRAGGAPHGGRLGDVEAHQANGKLTILAGYIGVADLAPISFQVAGQTVCRLDGLKPGEVARCVVDGGSGEVHVMAPGFNLAA
jgi:hypothetical protein